MAASCRSKASRQRFPPSSGLRRWRLRRSPLHRAAEKTRITVEIIRRGADPKGFEALPRLAGETPQDH